MQVEREVFDWEEAQKGEEAARVGGVGSRSASREGHLYI